VVDKEQPDLLIVSSSPHLKTRETTQRLMADVLIALAPAAAVAFWLFGLRAIALVVAAVASAVLTEHAVAALGKRKTTVGDLSAAITGLLIAFNIPPSAPFWLPVVGSMFAVLVVKVAFGGLGGNFLNPALAARAMLLAAWPVHMTKWVRPFDLVATATPLATLVPKGVAGAELPTLAEMFIGRIPGCLGETSAIALLIGGAYLLWRKVIDWHTPVGFIGTVAVLTLVFGPSGLLSDITFAGRLQASASHVLSGGLMLGAWFMATDYVTSPVTPKGRLIMGIGCGLLTVLIRLWGGYPEGVSYSILIMNVATPLIDRFTVPRKFGLVKKA
jgi:electron transport complex protein RnfD